MRGGDHDEIALLQQVEQPFGRPNLRDDVGHFAAHRVDSQDPHAEALGAAADLRTDIADAHHAERAIGEMQMPAINLADVGGPGGEVGPSRFSADRLPVAGALLVAVEMQVSREGEDEAHHVIGDHVRVQAAHVAQAAGMLDERVEHVVLEAGRRGLHPAQLFGAREERRRDLAEKGVGVGDLFERLGLVVGIDDAHGARGLANELESPIVHRGKEDEFHGGLRIDGEGCVKWLSRTLRREKKRFETSLLSKTARGKMAAVASTTSLSVMTCAGPCETSISSPSQWRCGSAVANVGFPGKRLRASFRFPCSHSEIKRRPKCR